MMAKDLTKPAKRVIAKAVEKHGPNLKCVCCYMERHNPGWRRSIQRGR
jgi:hypothetical protein